MTDVTSPAAHGHDRGEPAGTDLSTPAPTVSLPWRTLPGQQCFGCSHVNPFGLHLEFRHAGDGLAATFSLGRWYESYPGIIHGGIISTILDEVMGNCIALSRAHLAFTSVLRLRYIAPVLIDRPYRAEARITGDREGLVEAQGEVTDSSGVLLAVATGSYRMVSFDQGGLSLPLDPADDSFAGVLADGSSRLPDAPR